MRVVVTIELVNGEGKREVVAQSWFTAPFRCEQAIRQQAAALVKQVVRAVRDWCYPEPGGD
jgi:hypothetical protein